MSAFGSHGQGAQEISARKAALRARLETRKAAVRAAMDRRLGRRSEPRRKRYLLLLLLALLLLLLLRDCEEEPAISVSKVEVLSMAGAGLGGPAAASPPKSSRLVRQDRPAYATADPGPLPWVEALRLQVAARSPRLATCFVGVPRPGALRWSAAVEPHQGRVSDSVLEPVLATEPLKREQRECVLAVLSEPVYRLGGETRGTPVRLSLVVEF